MLKPNTENSNSELSATRKTPSNTHLFLHLPPTLSANRFHGFLSTLNQAKIEIKVIYFHLDYLRFSTTISTKKSFDTLLSKLGLPVPCFENKVSWHPDTEMPKNKKYQNSIQSDKGIKLGYTKRLLNNSRKPKYVYDIMIDCYGSYFADSSLLEQIKLIHYLNSNYKPKCHRIDVAIDDYSKGLFPILQILVAIEQGNHFGFEKVDESFLYCRIEGCIGTLALSSRHYERYVRIYTFHQYFDRWEAELKRGKAQKLFDTLANFGNNNTAGILPTKDICKALIRAALGGIDFRDKSNSSSPKNATKARTKQLPFWQISIDKLLSSIEN